jgi:pimeloyl-ACP methyl ester carboxylesterase
MVRARHAWVLLLAACWLAGAAKAQGPEVADVPTRAGVTERVLVLAPPDAAAVVLLLPGGSGKVGIGPGGALRNGGNFLVRSRELFAQQGLVAVVVDVPSDRRDLNGDFRDSREHAQDLGLLVQWARARFHRPVWLVGTSRGTQSAAAAALQLSGDAAPDGLVLTSSILGRNPRARVTARALPEMPLEQLRLPVLVVHHEQDPCNICDPAGLPALMRKLPAASAKLLTFTGGTSEGPPCEAFSHHGYNGIEDRVVAGIAAWIRAPH